MVLAEGRACAKQDVRFCPSGTYTVERNKNGNGAGTLRRQTARRYGLHSLEQRIRCIKATSADRSYITRALAGQHSLTA